MEATHGASGLRLFLSQFLHSIAFVAVSRYDWGVHVPRWCRRRVLIRKDHIQGIKHESFPASCTFFLVDALIACMFWETRTTTETQIGAQMCQWLSVNGVILAGRRSYSSFLLAWSICQCWGRHWWFGAPVELHVLSFQIRWHKWRYSDAINNASTTRFWVFLESAYVVLLLTWLTRTWFDVYMHEFCIFDRNMHRWHNAMVCTWPPATPQNVCAIYISFLSFFLGGSFPVDSMC